MADFSKPVTTDTYSNVLTLLKATTSDLALGLDPATTSPTNVPTNAVRWSSASNKWQKWNGTTWNDLASSYAINISGTAAGLSATLAIASGGTGATTAAAALVSLGERTGTTGSIKLPAGTSAQRDGTPTAGYFRFNTDLAQFEGYNGTSWSNVVGAGTSNADLFSGNGTTTAFTLSGNPGSLSNLDVSISGVTQTPGIDYTWSSGTTLTFTSAPPAGTNNVLVRYTLGLPQGYTDSAASTYTPAGAGAVTTTVQAKLREIVSAGDYAAVPNTGTDQSAALQAYLDRLNALGGGVFSPPPGVYRCDTPLTTYANIRWLCYGVTLDFSYRSSYMSTLDQGLIVARGTAASQVLFSADAAADSTSFSAVSASGLSVGDLLELSLSTGNLGNWTDSSVAVYTGQLNYITNISGSTVEIDSVIYDPMTVADGARYRKITPLKGVVIEGLTVKGKGRDVSGYGDVGISLFMCDGPVVKNCMMIGVDLRSINFVSCINFTATGNLLKFDPQGANTNVNYGITFSSSRDGEIAWNQAYNMRHGIVSSHLSSSLTNKYYGISRNVRVHHNTIGNAWHAGIATHNDAEFVSVHENTIRDSAFGVNLRDRNSHAHRNTIENSTGAALYLSAKPQKQTFIGNIIKNCAVGLATSSLNTGWKMQDIQVDGTVIDGGAAVIVFTPDGTSGVNKNINVTGTKAANISGPGGAAAVIRYNGAVQGTIADNEIYNCSNISGVSIAETASKVRVMRNVVINIGLTAFVLNNATGSLCAFNYYAGYTSGLTGITGVAVTSNTDGGSATI